MFKEERTSSAFHWSMLGDIEEGRPNLGPDMTVSVYRLMQYTLRDQLIVECGVAKADQLFFKAGHLAGTELYRHVIGEAPDLDSLFGDLQRVLRELKIGIFRVESADMERDSYVVTVAEDLDCSGIPVCSEEVCTYDEGFLAGIMKAHNGRDYRVKEVDCWGSGDRVCRFTIDPA